MNSSSIPSSDDIDCESRSIWRRHRPRPGTRAYPGRTGISNAKSTTAPLHKFVSSSRSFPAPATSATDTATSSNPEAPASKAASAVAAYGEASVCTGHVHLELASLAYLFAQHDSLTSSSGNVADGDRRRHRRRSLLLPPTSAPSVPGIWGANSMDNVLRRLLGANSDDAIGFASISGSHHSAPASSIAGLLEASPSRHGRIVDGLATERSSSPYSCLLLKRVSRHICLIDANWIACGFVAAS